MKGVMPYDTNKPAREKQELLWAANWCSDKYEDKEAYATLDPPILGRESIACTGLLSFVDAWVSSRQVSAE